MADAVAVAYERVRAHIRSRDDAAEVLRAAGLSATADGPVPTDDEATIRAWWNETPCANVGIATGAGSGLLVLDVVTAI